MISIAMATYNGEKYLREQINSILNQTIQDFELMICDDCSSDNTWNILLEYQSQDKRIKCFRNEENLGFKKNFEKAIRLCSGEYIALSDQDDIWLPEHLEKLVNIIGDADIACGNAELIDGKGNSMGLFLSETKELEVLYSNEKLIYRILCNNGLFQGASMLISRDCIKNTLILPIPEGIGYHDVWFTIFACLNKGFKYTYDIVTLYRQHLHNTSPLHKKIELKDRILNSIKNICQEYKTDRFIYIQELLKRVTMSEKQKKILEECSMYLRLHKGELPFRKKMQCLSWFWKHYKYIFTSKTNKYRLSRTIKLFLTK